MKVKDVIAQVMFNAGIAGSGVNPVCYRQVQAALAYCTQRLLLPELLVTKYQIASTSDGQVLFAVPTLQHVVRESFKWIKGTEEYLLDWRVAPTSISQFPYCVWQTGSNFKVNPNSEVAGAKLQFDYYTAPTLGAPTVDFPYPQFEDYCINMASAKVLMATDSAKASPFAQSAKALWTGISATIEQ